MFKSASVQYFHVSKWSVHSFLPAYLTHTHATPWHCARANTPMHPWTHTCARARMCARPSLTSRWGQTRRRWIPGYLPKGGRHRQSQNTSTSSFDWSENWILRHNLKNKSHPLPDSWTPCPGTECPSSRMCAGHGVQHSKQKGMVRKHFIENKKRKKFLPSNYFVHNPSVFFLIYKVLISLKIN